MNKLMKLALVLSLALVGSQAKANAADDALDFLIKARLMSRNMPTNVGLAKKELAEFISVMNDVKRKSDEIAVEMRGAQNEARQEELAKKKLIILAEAVEALTQLFDVVSSKLIVPVVDIAAAIPVPQVKDALTVKRGGEVHRVQDPITGERNEHVGDLIEQKMNMVKAISRALMTAVSAVSHVPVAQIQAAEQQAAHGASSASAGFDL